MDLRLLSCVQLFYGRQIQLLDEGRVADWAGTFTRDAVLAGRRPEPERGRETIERAALRGRTALAAQGLVQRHWIGMPVIDELPDGALRVRSYALVVETDATGNATIRHSAVLTDVLVEEGAELRVRDRRIVKDRIAAASGEAALPPVAAS